MSYHLNIFYSDDLIGEFTLEEVISKLEETKLSVSVAEHQTHIKELLIQELDIGKLYFSNGLFWSIYESDNQLKRLIGAMKPLELTVMGEEGETYTVNGSRLEWINSKEPVSRGAKVRILDFFGQRKIGLIILLIFGLMAWTMN